MFENYPDVVDFNQLMKMLNMGRNKAYKLLQEKKVKHFRNGVRYLIPKNSIITYINDMCYNDENVIGVDFKIGS